MPPTRSLTIIRAAFLDLNEISLGSLVPDPSSPGVNFHPTDPCQFLPGHVSIRHVENLHQLLAKEKHRGIHGRLTQLFASNGAGQEESKVEIIAPKSTVYYIKHPSLHFTELCKNDETKQWIRRIIKHNDIFLVVGFITVTQANVQYGRKSSYHFELNANVPITDVLSHGATAAFPDVAKLLDSGGGMSTGSQAKTVSSFIAPGERVIGIQYNKVHFEWFSKGNVDEATLKDNQWKMFLGARDRGSDVYQADAHEIMELDELGLERYDTSIEDDEFVFIDEDTKES